MKWIACSMLVAAAMLLAPSHPLFAQCQHCNGNGGHCQGGTCNGGGCMNGDCGDVGLCNYGKCPRRGNLLTECGHAARTMGKDLRASGMKGLHGAAAQALCHPWHCNYYHMEYGSPVALVVPPTAERHYNLGWGVANSRLARTWHHFGRAYPGTAGGGGGYGQQFLATPPFPSDTSQFGVYYVRGPW